MKKTILTFIFTMAGFNSTSASINPIEIRGAGVSFLPPSDFTRLSEEELDLKFPRSNRPSFAIGNENRSTTVAYDIKPIKISDDKLKDLIDVLVKQFDASIPDLKWLHKKIVFKKGRKWIFLELKSPTPGFDVHNRIYLTRLNNKVLILNFNSTVKDFPKYSRQMSESFDSISFSSSSMKSNRAQNNLSDLPIWFGPLLILVSIFSLWASLADKEWYWRMANFKGKALRYLIGDKSYRVFCIILNIGFFAASVYITWICWVN